MDKMLDLQLFAGEGVAGDGGGVPGGASGMPRPTDAQTGRDQAVDGTRNGQARSLQEDGLETGRDRAAQAGNDTINAPCELAGGPAAGMPRPTDAQTERDRGTKVGDDSADAAGGASRMPRPTGAQTGRDRAAQARDDTRNISCELKDHFRRLEGEAEQMREVFPGFDLRRELRDPRFAALTAPGMGVSVEDAYYALHRRELQAASMQVAAQAAARKLASSIQSAARRPVENGSGSSSPAGFSLRHMSREQREELRRRIHTAAAMGEKIFP